MKTFLGLLIGCVVLLTGFWAYQENYRTRQTISDLRSLQREIGALRGELAVLEVEWAYLNRPERLRALADLNFETLQLIPMRPEHFGVIDQIAFAPQLPMPEEGEGFEGLLDPAELLDPQLLPAGYEGGPLIDMADVVAPEPVPDAQDGQFP
ncbi:MAG: cell division protein FtsL [Mangrovicoccus sp.]|nr:cell division protein FtsL [Mangrovicoccus sp.]